MNKLEKKSYREVPLNIIRLLGILAMIAGVKELLAINSAEVYISLAVTALLYLLFSPQSVTLPSGASWRPAMAFILFSLLNFDYRLVILIAIPGALFISRGKKDFFSRVLLTIGQLSVGIYAAGIVRELMNINFSASIVSYIAMTVCLIAHFLGNRFVAVIIVAIHKQRSILKQIYLIKNDLNWGYFCAYIVGILMYLIYRVYYIPGILLVIVLLITIYQALTYYIKLKDIEEKIYLDGLTDAESRMSWEEFLKENNDLYKTGMVYMMDLDYFKVINDTYGHNFGDKILQEFVIHIKKEMKRKYRLFRYGGDEFILVVYSPEQDYANVCKEVSNIFTIQNNIWSENGLAVSVSFGYAHFSKQENIESIVRKADKCMYMNKFKKNTVRSVHS